MGSYPCGLLELRTLGLNQALVNLRRIKHQIHHKNYAQDEKQGEYDTRDNEVNGFTSGEVAFSIAAVLYAKSSCQGAGNQLPG